MGAVGDGLVVEQDSLGRHVLLEEFVPLLPVLQSLLYALKPGLVFNFKVSDEGKLHDVVRPLYVCIQFHKRLRENIHDIILVRFV